jgi:hypothetical protein
MVINAEHLDWVLTGITREVLDTLQRVDVLKNFNEILGKQMVHLLESRRQNEERGSEGVSPPLQLGKGQVVCYAVGPSYDGCV